MLLIICANLTALSPFFNRQTFARGQSSLSYKGPVVEGAEPDLELGEVKKYVCYCKAHKSKPKDYECVNEEYIQHLVKERQDKRPIDIVHAHYNQDPKGDKKYSECLRSLRLLFSYTFSLTFSQRFESRIHS